MTSALVEPLPWDSEFFGLPIARVPATAGDAERLDAAVRQCERDGIRCAYLLVDAAQESASALAQERGFVLRDVRVELDRPIGAADNIPAPAPAPIAPAVPEQTTALERLTRERFTISRFFADPRFPQERCSELYVQFLRRGLAPDSRRQTLVLGAALGYVVCHLDEESGVGTIELIATARDSPRGAGGGLVRAASAVFATAGMRSATVVTQGRNVAAQRTYQGAGYRTCRTSLWFHRWFD
ncbi:MAG: putative acetyltransferase [Conexibacter sp.]|nr:putative acetyltransferase [Conexibacter sp.]